MFAVDFKMKDQKEYFRHILLCHFPKGKNAVSAHNNLCDVYGKNALKLHQCQNWFAKFSSGDFDVKDAPSSGRPIEVNDKSKTVLNDMRDC